MEQAIALASEWILQSREANLKSEDLWEKLRTGEIGQDDETIYLCYELAARASTLRQCAAALLGAVVK